MTEKSAQEDATKLLQRIAPALHEARQQLEAAKRRAHEPIAIVSMALRFPGADSPEAFWKLLEQGEDKVIEIPADRWAVDDYFDPQPGRPNKMYIREAAFLDEVDKFDAAFFDISPREAASLDPQHRILLEVAWEAFERAGMGPGQLADNHTGVFVGMSENDYARFENNGDNYNVYATTGNSNYFAAGRLSYLLGLQGPNMIIDTACSASLVAVHLACQSLRQGECDLALAGGIQLMLIPDPMIATAQLNAFAPDGRCKTFDASADGYGRGEGCGVVMLKRLSDALAAGDTVLSVVRGSAVNHGGRGSGLTSPNKSAQEALLRQALKNAKVKPGEVSYIEAHGTGTQLGDPIEMGALNRVFADDARSDPLWVGSVKTNIGHLEPASGIAGLIKVVLSLQEKQIPASLHFDNPNPFIDWDASPVKVPTQCIPWTGADRIAGVSSFGMSGTNCSLIVGEAPPLQRAPSEEPDPDRPEHILTLSAKNESALNAMVQRYRVFLQENPNVSLADLCFSANTGRHHFSHRLSITAQNISQLAEQLESYPQSVSERLFHGVLADNQLSPQIAFLFTGQGSQYPDMGRELYETQPYFRHIMDQCDHMLRPLLDESLLKILYATNEAESALLNQTMYTQPALFALEYALAKLWMAWGIEPDVVLGHSVGEYAAACLAGIFNLEDGLKLIVARSRLMQELPVGKMLSVRSNQQYVEAIITPYFMDVSIAAINGPNSVVISGNSKIVDQLAGQFAAEGVDTHFLTVSHAFHSPMMTPMLDAFREVANTIAYRQPDLPLISNVTGELISDEIATPDYWVKHVREAVRFADSIAALQEQHVDILLEVGSKPLLLGMVKQIYSEDDTTTQPLMMASLREQGDNWQHILSACGQCYISGVEVDWMGFDKGYSRSKCLLPTYPFQRQRYWVDLNVAKQQPSAQTQTAQPEKLTRLSLDNHIVFETRFSLQHMPYMVDHKIMGEVVVPGACFVSMMFKAAQQLFPDTAHELQDVIFHQPIVLGADEEYRVQTILSPPDLPNPGQSSRSLSREIQILSFPATGDLQTEFKIHASGTLSILPMFESAVMTPDDLRQHCPNAISHAQWYNHIVETGIVLGPAFGWVSELWQGEGKYLGHLRRPPCVGDIHGNPLHLALLDSCLIVADNMNDERSVTKLPLSLDSVQLYHPATGDEWWCYAQKSDHGKFDFVLLDKVGRVLLKAIGFADKEAPADKFFKKETLTRPDKGMTGKTLIHHSDPVLSKMMHLPSTKQVIFEAEYSLHKLPYMADLGIFGQIIIPISYSVSLLLHAARTLFPARTHELKDLIFQKPLPANTGEEHVLQAVISTEKNPNLDFRLINFQTNRGDDNQAKTYAIGSLAIHHQVHQPRFLDLNELLERCPQSAGFDDWYPLVSKKGYQLGPYFYEWIDALWRGENETLTRMSLPREVGSVEGHQLYFALFHGCIMATNLLFLQEDLIVRTPYAIESMHLYSPATGDEWWCYSQRIASGKYNFQLLNNRGMIIAEVLAYTEREVLQEETFFQESDPYKWLYQTDWQPQPPIAVVTDEAVREKTTAIHQEAVKPLPVFSGRCLIYSGGSHIDSLLAERLTENGLLTKVNTTQSADDLAALLSTLPDLQQAIYLWDDGHESAAYPPQETQNNCAALLMLTQGLLNTYPSPPKLLIVTRGAQAVIDRDPLNGFAQSAAWGLARTIAVEHPELQCVCMDVDAPNSLDVLSDAILAQLESSILSASKFEEDRIAWREGQRYVARLSRYENLSGQTQPIRADGSYLITGGRGGIGLQIARWLVEQGARHLVLLGRSQPGSEVLETLNELTANGVKIESAIADITDEQALTKIVTDLSVPLRGIVHAAGVLDDASLLQQTPDKLRRVLLPKVQGAWNLHKITLEQPLDFFVLFSSASSLLGASGQANYAAGNGFLDGLAAYRQTLGLPALSINWGAWGEVGMAVQQGLLGDLKQQGEEAIPLQQGLTLFGELLSEPCAQLGIVPIQWSRFLAYQKGNTGFYANFANTVRMTKKSAAGDSVKESVLAQLRKTRPAERQQVLEAHFRAEIAQLLGINISELPNEEGVGFVELGLDSLTSIDLRNSLQRRLDCALPVTFAFDYPTIEQAVEYLTEVVLTPMEGTSLQQPTKETPPSQISEATPTNKEEDESLSSMLDRLSAHLD